MAGFQLPPDKEKAFMDMLQAQGGGPGEGLSPEQQQQIMDQGAQAAAADMGGQGTDVPPTGAPQDPSAMAQPAAPAAPPQDPNAELLQAMGFGSVQELAEAFKEKAQGYDQAKDELTQLLGFRQALNNAEELDPKDPDYSTKKVFREMLGPVADKFTESARMKLLADAWNMDARGLADAEALLPEINSYIQQNPKLAADPSGFRQAYNAVRSGKYRGEDQLFSDPDFIAKASKHEAIKKAVMQSQLENLARNGEMPPAVGQGGNTPFTGAGPKPKTIEEAGRQMGKLLGLR